MKLLPAALLVIAASAAVFSQTVEFEFINRDDDINVTANPHLNPVRADGLAELWTAPYAGLYIPLSYTLWAGVAAVSRDGSGSAAPLDPGPFHAVNVALHALAAVLVLVLLRRFTDRTPPALAGALLFALHPLQVESVAWVTELRGLLAACFGFAALLLHVKDAREPRKGRALLALSLFAAALLAKPSAVALPLVLLALDVFALRRGLGAALRTAAPWFLLAGVAVVAAKAQQDVETIGEGAPLWARPLVAGDALAFYLGKLVWPVPLAMDYGRTPEVAMGSAGFYLLWLIPAALIVCVWRVPALRAARAPLAIFVAGLLPVLGLVPFGYQRISTVADRYVYLAMLGPALGVALALGRAQAKGRARALGLPVAALLIALAWKSHAQVATWRTSETVFAHAAAVTPESWSLHVNLGADLSAAGRVEEARAHYLEALRIDPTAAPALYNLGAIAFRSGHLVEARNYLERAIDAAPAYAEAHASLGLVATQQGDVPRAEAALRESLRIRPDRAKTHEALGVLFAQTGRLDEAYRHFGEAVRLEPGYVQGHFNLGYTAAQLGRTPEARGHYERALELQHDFLPAQRGLKQLARDAERNP